MNKTWPNMFIRWFIYSAGIILLADGLIRFAMATGQSQILNLPEPMMGIPLRFAVLLIGAFELIVALICLFSRRIGLQLGWLAWLATNYWIYRVGLLTMHCHVQASCIGSFTDPLQLEHGIIDVIIGFFPYCLLIGSYTALLWLWVGKWILTRNRWNLAGSIKMSCPACGRHIKFAFANLGQRIPCPQCQTTIILRKPEERLKISCFFCKEHIEFPPHAIGEKMPCPHCNMDITLKEPA